MKFSRMVDLVGYQYFPLLVNFGPGVSPRGQKVETFGNANRHPRLTVVSSVQQTHWTAVDRDSQCCKLFAVTAIGMWGYTPVRITGVLVAIFFS